MKKTGITLLNLIITIIVVIILAGAVIFSLTQSNPAEKANEAVFKQNINAFAEELEMYKINEISRTTGNYDTESLNADKNSATYNGKSIADVKDISEIIKSMKGKKEYLDTLAVKKGELVYIGTDETKKEWSKNVGVENQYKDLVIGDSISLTEVKAGTNVTYELKFESQYTLTSILLDGKITLVNVDTNEEVTTQNIVTIGEVKEITDKEKTVEVEVDTISLVNGNYALKLGTGIVKDSNNMTNVEEKTTKSFEVKTVEYKDITFISSNTKPTNENVEVEIVFPEGITKKEYKLDATSDFVTYTTKILVDKNLTIYAKGEDSLGNIVNTSYTVGNIDKTAPKITLAEVSKTTSSVTLKATASDAGGSNINASSYEYSKDDGVTWTTTSSNTTYTFSGLTSGTYKFKARVKDNATNVGTSTTLTVATTGVDTLESGIKLTASTSSWTNQNVSVTITYPAELTTKEYKLGASGTWTAYTGAIPLSSNNTVYARGKDVAGNTTKGVPTLSVGNIDIEKPTVSFSPNGINTTSSSTSTKITAGDSLSGINNISYVWSTSTTTPTSGWTSASNNSSLSRSSNGTWYLWIKVADNAGNELITRSNSFYINYTYVPPEPTYSASADIKAEFLYDSLSVRKHLEIKITNINLGTFSLTSVPYKYSIDGGSTWISSTSPTYTYSGTISSVNIKTRVYYNNSYVEKSVPASGPSDAKINSALDAAKNLYYNFGLFNGGKACPSTPPEAAKGCGEAYSAYLKTKREAVISTFNSNL